MNQSRAFFLFSSTHLMLAMVLSMDWSSAKVPEPKPTSELSALNCFSWYNRHNVNQWVVLNKRHILKMHGFVHITHLFFILELFFSPTFYYWDMLFVIHKMLQTLKPFVIVIGWMFFLHTVTATFYKLTKYCSLVMAQNWMLACWC